LLPDCFQFYPARPLVCFPFLQGPAGTAHGKQVSAALEASCGYSYKVYHEITVKLQGLCRFLRVPAVSA
jgi:hypothetical protein